MKHLPFLFILIVLLGCNSHDSQAPYPKVDAPIISEDKEMMKGEGLKKSCPCCDKKRQLMPKEKKDGQDHANCEVLSYSVSAHLMFPTIYTVPKHCFDPYVKNSDITAQNQRRELLLKIIGVMEARSQHKTGAEMLDICWEKLWKWDHISGPRPNHFPAVCAISGVVTREDIEIVKAIERCRLECLSQRKERDYPDDKNF